MTDVSLRCHAIFRNVTIVELIPENAVFIIHTIKMMRTFVCFRVHRDNLKTQFPLHWNNVKFDMQYPVHHGNDIRHDISFYWTFHPVHRNALMRVSKQFCRMLHFTIISICSCTASSLDIKIVKLWWSLRLTISFSVTLWYIYWLRLPK